MFVYTLLFTGLLGLVGALPSPPPRICVLPENDFGKVEKLINETKKCLCNETFGIEGDYNPTECKCFEVPKREDNCNLSCITKGFEKLEKLKKLNFFKHFNSRVRFCTEKVVSCHRPCADMENVTATNFLKRYADTLKQIKSELESNKTIEAN